MDIPQHRELLVIKLLLVLGAIEVSALGFLQIQGGSARLATTIAYPTLAICFIVYALIIHWRPESWSSMVKRLFFSTISLGLVAIILEQVFSRPPLTESYRLANSLLWSSFMYVADFVFFRRREALIRSVVTFLLLFIPTALYMVFTGLSDWSPSVKAMVVNMFGVHLMLILTLSLVSALKEQLQIEKSRADEMSSLREREQELAETAQAAEQAKSNFLAVMSHEIRTPMNGVLGFTELLAQSQLTEEQESHVSTIQQSGSALLRIIDDILDYSRIEAGRLKIENGFFCPKEQVEDICILLAALSQSNEVTLTSSLEPKLPNRVMGDPGRVRQVLINLVGNAIKFSQGGQVTLGARKKFEGKETFIEFFITDNGIGVAPDKLAAIFEPFSQADASSSRRKGGTGLGLPISKSLAELMGGKLTIETKLGTGSTFALILPYRMADWTPPIYADPLATDENQFAAFHPLKIMVAEDDAINRKLVLRVLEKLGYRPVLAADGEEAVKLYQSERPDCILMDLKMPGLDGLEATRLIRQTEQSEGIERPAFICALTANVFPEDRAQCLGAGMNSFLTKPLRQGNLLDALKEAEKSRYFQEESAEGSEA